MSNPKRSQRPLLLKLRPKASQERKRIKRRLARSPARQSQ